MKNSVQYFVVVISGVLIAFISGDTTTTTPDNSITDDDYNNSCSSVSQLVNLSVNSSSKEIHLSWEKANNNPLCEINYDINITLLSGSQIIPYFRHENRTYHTITDLESCSKYFVSIMPTTFYDYDDRSLTETFEITTLPEKVQNLSLRFQNDKNQTHIEWVPPKNKECISEYIVIWDTNNFITTSNTALSLGGLHYCVNFTVQAKTEQDSVGEVETLTIPGPVLNLTTKVNSSSVILSWDPPENSQCVEQYIIELNGSFINVTSLTYYRFPNLTYCLNYTFSVTAESVGGISMGEPTVLEEYIYPTELGPVHHLEASDDNVDVGETVNITWSVPHLAHFCTVTYEVVVTNNNISKVNTTDPFFEFNTTNVTPCSETYVSITPILRGVVGESNNVSVQVNPKVPYPPLLTNYSSGTTWIHFNWTVDVEIYNCSTNLINVTCIWEEGEFYHTENVTEDYYSFNKTDLQPFTTYLCWAYTENFAGMSNSSKLANITTSQAPPSSPTNLRVESLTSTSFIIAWELPEFVPGVQNDYRLEIYCGGPLHYIPEICNVSREYSINYNLSCSTKEYYFSKAEPNFWYIIRLAASTEAGLGNYSQISIVTPQAGPEPVRDLKYTITYFNTEQYHAEINISFNPPCNTNGNLTGYNIILTGSRENYNCYIYEKQLQELQPVFRNLSAGYYYVLEVTAATSAGSGTSIIEEFTAPDGVPPEVFDPVQEPEEIDSETAKFVFTNRLFSDINGDIIYYAIILADADFNKSSYGFWNYSQDDWPFVGYWNDEGEQVLPYQATVDYWNPFGACSKVCNHTYILGGSKCSPNTTCNGPLRKDTEYSLVVRGFTRHGYRDTPPIFFVIYDPGEPLFELDIPKFIGAIIGCVAAITLFGFTYMIWKRQQNRTPKPINTAPKLSEMDNLQPIPVPIPINKFPDVYRDLKINGQKLKQQYALINTKSSEEMLPYYAALLPNNRKKNRYTNILPFDETRVKLVNEKDPRNDYINASFIKGYSGKIEYIATQGPLAYTCADFWKMIIQENVTVIAMVAHFVEMNQPKCYKYFPNKHENMDVGEGIEVRCATELNFGMYCLRTLLIQKDLKQWTITHLQFLDWPDHGCPTGTEVMIHFCHVLRQHVAKLPGPVAVHCSAGVGRTGTLIAVDILLQAVTDKKDIDIFGTVLNLRRQRAKMVQTEKQYWYIHSCIFDVIDNPKLLNWEQAQNESEPIYENLEEVKINSKESQL